MRRGARASFQYPPRLAEHNFGHGDQFIDGVRHLMMHHQIQRAAAACSRPPKEGRARPVLLGKTAGDVSGVCAARLGDAVPVAGLRPPGAGSDPPGHRLNARRGRVCDEPIFQGNSSHMKCPGLSRRGCVLYW